MGWSKAGLSNVPFVSPGMILFGSISPQFKNGENLQLNNILSIYLSTTQSNFLSLTMFLFLLLDTYLSFKVATEQEQVYNSKIPFL